jgi:hypothetical protein
MIEDCEQPSNEQLVEQPFGETFIGTKIIQALGLSHEDWLKLNGKYDPNAETMGDGYAVKYEDGCKSWSPKHAFEEAYRRTKGNLTFGLATEAAKYKGERVARKGWNGSGMYAYIVPAASYPAQTDIARKEFGDMVPYREYWALKTAQGDVATWAPSGSDSLAEDWYILD